MNHTGDPSNSDTHAHRTAATGPPRHQHRRLRAPDGAVRARSKGVAVMADGGTGTVTYDDTLVQADSVWRIARRKVIKPGTD